MGRGIKTRDQKMVHRNLKKGRRDPNHPQQTQAHEGLEPKDAGRPAPDKKHGCHTFHEDQWTHHQGGQLHVGRLVRSKCLGSDQTE